MNQRLSCFGMSCIFLLVCAAPGFSQTAPASKDAVVKEEKLPTADELADKCAKGSGGKEAWAKLQTMVMTGTIEIPTFRLTGKMEIYAKRPNKTLQITTVMDGQFVQKKAFDGEAGWKSDPRSGLSALTGAELEQTKLEATFDTDVRLKDVYPDMKVTGRAKVGDRDAYTVLAHEPGEKTVTIYFDTQTGLRIGEDSVGPDETGNVIKTNVFIEDYRSAGGIQIPYRIRVVAPNLSVVIKIDDVQLNATVDDAKFAMPSANPGGPPQ